MQLDFNSTRRLDILAKHTILLYSPIVSFDFALIKFFSEGTMAQSVLISGILRKLTSLAEEEIISAWGFIEGLGMLRTRFIDFQQFVRHTEDPLLTTTESEKNWLRKLNAVAVHADNVLDELEFLVHRKKSEEQNRMIKNEVLNFFSFPIPIEFRIKLAQQVKKINLLSDKLYTEENELGLRQLGTATATRVTDTDTDTALATATATRVTDIDTATATATAATRVTDRTHPFVDDSQIIFDICDRLPSSSLKQCFAYCHILPKYCDIEKDKLIQLWMAQGYLDQHSLGSNHTMEDVGNDYVNTLLGNVSFYDVKMDRYNNITSCKMHDYFRGPALDIFQDKLLTLIAGYGAEVHPEVQHLSLYCGARTTFKIPKEIVGKLKTLFLTGNLPKNFAHAKFIHALALDNDVMEELPSSIRKFMYLNYLDLSRTKIKTLPDFLTKLYNLQTLRLPSCEYLEKLPNEFHNLVSLRHFYFAGVQHAKQELVPIMVGCLTSLQTLPFFIVRDMGYAIEELGSLHNLRGTLQIHNLERVRNREEVEKANLSRKSKIHKLKLFWSNIRDVDENNDEDVLEGLKPHGDLKDLTIKFFEGNRFASWMMTRSAGDVLHNLVTINLSDCIGCEQLPPLGHLPHLEEVDIHGLYNVKSIGPEFYGHSVVNHDYDGDGGIVGSSSTSGEAAAEAGALLGVFPALRKLHLGSMGILEEWSEVPSSDSARVFFPYLEDLHISCCSHLITIPSHFLPFQELYIGPFTKNALHDLRDFRETYSPRLTIMVDWPDVGIDDLLKDVLEKYSKSLRNIKVEECYGLRHLPNTLQNLMSLQNLEIIRCHDLNSVVEGTEEEFSSLTSLQQLRILECSKLTCLPKRLPQTLVTLEIKQCPKLIMPSPDELCNLTSLQALAIVNCPGLASCWDEAPLCLTSLRRLEIGGFSEELAYFPWPFPSGNAAAADADADAATAEIAVVDMDIHHHLQQYPFVYLESLVLVGWPKLKSLPDQLQHLIALRELSIEHFAGLECLPEWLGNLASLQSLQLLHCKNLMCLSSQQAMGSLTQLRSLVIAHCPRLVERCNRGKGPEWPKIAHLQLNFIPKWY